MTKDEILALELGRYLVRIEGKNLSMQIFLFDNVVKCVLGDKIELHDMKSNDTKLVFMTLQCEVVFWKEIYTSEILLLKKIQ